MVITLGFLISFAAGWSIASADALFRAEERPGIFRGTAGMVLLLVIAAVGGLTIAGAIIWVFQAMISAGVLVIVAAGGVLGGGAARRVAGNAAGAANRMMIGFAVLLALYTLVWTVYPPTVPVPAPEPAQSAPASK